MLNGYYTDVDLPVSLPNNLTSWSHLCVMLIADGVPPDEAVVLLELRPTEGGYEGNCPECGSQFFSAHDA